MNTNRNNEEQNRTGLITNKFIEIVSRFRSFTTDPIITSSKWFIYGLGIFTCALVAIILLSIAIFKIIDQSIPGGSWLALFSLGLFSTALGILLLKKAKTDIH